MSTVCQVCGKTTEEAELVPAALVRPAITEVIRTALPEWSSSGFLCVDDLNGFRSRYIQSLLEAEKGELTSLEDDVVRSLREHEILSSNTGA